MDIVQTIDRRIRGALAGIRQAFRGRVARVDSAQPIQRIQIEGLAGETVQALEHGEPFGLTAHPPTGSDCVVVPLGGRTSHGIIVSTSNGAYRVQGLKPGETAVYNASGAKIVLKAGQVIEIDCATLRITAGQIEVNADKIKVNADTAFTGALTSNGKNISASHTHGGVTSGGATTGGVS